MAELEKSILDEIESRTGQSDFGVSGCGKMAEKHQAQTGRNSDGDCTRDNIKEEKLCGG